MGLFFVMIGIKRRTLYIVMEIAAAGISNNTYILRQLDHENGMLAAPHAAAPS